MKTYRLLTLILVVVMALSACNLPSASPTEQPLDPNAVFTAAAQTVEVQLTQNSLLIPTKPAATATIPPPEVTNTPPAPAPIDTIAPVAPIATNRPIVVATTGCDAAQFVNDVTVPDGTTFKQGAGFTKTWRLKNIGTCTWSSSYALVFDSGDAMGGAANTPLSGSTAPGGTVDISVNLQAPAKDGTSRGYWGIINASGTRVPVTGGSNGKSFYVEVKVGDGGGSGGTSIPGTTIPGTEAPGKFAVLSVAFTTSRTGTCESGTGQFTVIATITTNKAGTVSYTWVRGDELTNADYSGTLVFDSAGTKTITFQDVALDTILWADLIIDSPNHQQFGRATLSCS